MTLDDIRNIVRYFSQLTAIWARREGGPLRAMVVVMVVVLQVGTNFFPYRHLPLNQAAV